MRKRFVGLCCMLLLVLGIAVPAYGWTENPLLVDGANLLNSREESLLLETLEEISARQQMDIVVVTTYSLQGYSPRTFADDYYDYNGYADDGILLLISMEYRDWYISTTGDGIYTFTDAGLEYMSNRFMNDLSNGDYYDAFMTYAKLCDEYIDQAKSGRPYDEGHLPKGSYPFGFSLLVSFGIGFIVALIIVGIMASQLKTVGFQRNAKNYVKTGSLHITNAREMFLYRQVRRRARPKQSSSGGGSRTHMSSSGRSHGGGGGKF